MTMESFHNNYRTIPPATMDSDTLMSRIFEYRDARQVLHGESEEGTRMQLEAALAELEQEALKRGLKYTKR